MTDICTCLFFSRRVLLEIFVKSFSFPKDKTQKSILLKKFYHNQQLRICETHFEAMLSKRFAY